MTGTCDNCKHFSDDLVMVYEGELICKKCMLEFAAAYAPGEDDAEILDATEIERDLPTKKADTR